MALSPLQAISGQYGRVLVNGVSASLAKYTVTPSCGDIHSTNFNSLGWEEGIFGITVAEIKLEGMYDGALDPFESLGFVPGGYTYNVKIYMDIELPVFFNFPVVRCISMGVDTNVEDAARVVINLRTHGPFFFPLNAEPNDVA